MTLREYACTTTYKDTESLIASVVSGFCERYGQRFDDWIGEANLLFMEAYDSFEPKQARFSTHLQYRLWKGMLEKLRRQMKRHYKLPRRVELSEGCRVTGPDTWLVDFMDGLSEDAKQVVGLIINTPIDVRLAVFQRSPKNRNIWKEANHKNEVGACRAGMREFLNSMGWATERVSNAFAEVGSALR